MFKKVGADMVLYYALSNNDNITSAMIAQIHNEILKKLPISFIDTTLSSMQEIIREQNGLFELTQINENYTIKKKATKSIFFDLDFLDHCYSPFFEENEFNQLKNILLMQER